MYLLMDHYPFSKCREQDMLIQRREEGTKYYEISYKRNAVNCF